jgi:hypothetical protein
VEPSSKAGSIAEQPLRKTVTLDPFWVFLLFGS